MSSLFLRPAQSSRIAPSSLPYSSLRPGQHAPSTSTIKHISFTSRPIKPQNFHVRHQKRFRQAFNYQQFQRSQNFFVRWRQQPTFYLQVTGIGAGLGIYYYTHLETVPVSNRTRFRNVSYELEREMGQSSLEEALQEYGRALLPPNHPYTQAVARVAKRLIPYSGLQDEQWQIFVVNAKEHNAFVIPGGKIFVMAGMFDLCRTDDMLAAVISHEIGHNVAHHMAERLSQSKVTLLLAGFLALTTGVDFGIQRSVLNFVLEKPGSRAQESEADYIGLMMMSEACYDPHAAMDVWTAMQKMEEGQATVPQWLSTHPTHKNRFTQIREWLPKAEAKAAESDCRTTASSAADFWSSQGYASPKAEYSLLR